MNSQNHPVGWIGAIRQNGGRVWEIHPLMVTKSEQGKGFGRALVNDIEELAQAAGVLKRHGRYERSNECQKSQWH